MRVASAAAGPAAGDAGDAGARRRADAARRCRAGYPGNLIGHVTGAVSPGCSPPPLSPDPSAPVQAAPPTRRPALAIPGSITAMSSMTTSSMAMASSASTTAAATSSWSVTYPTATTSSDNSGSTSKSSSPLLFFVALGFGILFANLWIIIGVKYCFKRNRRLREQRRLGILPPDAYDEEDGRRYIGDTDFPLEQLFGGARYAPPPRRRRRKEKKLMTVEQLDEKFPIKTYKAWRCERETAGLSAVGGVSLSRAGSLRMSMQAERPDEAELEAELEPSSSETTYTAPVTDDKKGAAVHVETQAVSKSVDTAETMAETMASAGVIVDRTQSTESSADRTAVTDATDNTEHTTTSDLRPIDSFETASSTNKPTPVAVDDLGDSGDVCIICIDALEDNDEVRGLTCGHAFHAACILPWLTTRRACCPLCKADYYVPRATADVPAPEPAVVHGSAPPPPASYYHRIDRFVAPRLPRLRPRTESAAVAAIPHHELSPGEAALQAHRRERDRAQYGYHVDRVAAYDNAARGGCVTH
ncbi:uncharacterized protein V1510DRAFT_413851 [Dipodascopsis tothii]|uniref:uncharacterized protein n=1 Tax=Dipodascopsis tothii TaxID=44089 RepID=UPI0034CFBA60